MRRALAGLAGMPDHVEVAEPADVDGLAARTGWPVVLKAVRGGYDGRGCGCWTGPTRGSSRSCSPRARR